MRSTNTSIDTLYSSVVDTIFRPAGLLLASTDKANTMESMLKIFFYLHIVGLILIGVGLYLLLYGGAGQEINGMFLIAATLGLGGLMISPYPVVKAIHWMRSNDTE